MSWPAGGSIRRSELFEVQREAAPGPVEAHPAGDLRAAENPRCGAQRELLPRDQAQDLAVSLAQPRERTGENVVALDRQEGVLRRRGAPRQAARSGRSVVVRERL